MILALIHWLSDGTGMFNLFRYLTFRSGGALLTALCISFILGPTCIKWLKNKQKKGQPIRKDGPESHLITKVGTPTMGGVLILLSLLISTLLWADLTNPRIWVVLGVYVSFGLLGLADDYLKVTQHNTKGVSGKLKLITQITISLVAIYIIHTLSPPALQGMLTIPFFKSLLVPLGFLMIPFALCVIVGASNAVNLTDGLDGLAIVPIMLVAASFALISYLCGNVIFANYLQIHYIPGAGEIAIFCSALIGAGLGFLWYNAPPAMVFMGDTGSLSAGGALGTIALIIKHELVLAIIGGLFVLEAVSVILQVASFKLTGKRIFAMAPLHHHFEKKGWAESTIVVRFWIIATILALIGLATLKIR
jgi:phospho-N-acetylmuramoyl-pentapeptide-transferase